MIRFTHSRHINFKVQDVTYSVERWVHKRRTVVAQKKRKNRMDLHAAVGSAIGSGEDVASSPHRQGNADAISSEEEQRSRDGNEDHE